ncbi:hypothetical protein [Leifsonia aquatica]|uniref:hypothetical protein n=1 Tax=Leifsonia aquatica TaxID=144185 RepID=UPI00046A5C20|nr:hypothetical protein [Leifsonia aquatica]
MRKNLLILVIVALAAYLVGVESAKRRGKNYEDLRHQLERIWKDPDARKSRKRLARKASKAAKRFGDSLEKKLS